MRRYALRGIFKLLLINESKVKDITLYQLRELLDLIDSKLYEIDECISKSADPDTDGLLDRGEYFIGIGFVAIQHHLNESLIGMEIGKKDAYSLGSIHSSGISSIGVINAAANWWKHESEWFINGKGESEIIMEISETREYALSNVLASFSESKCLSLVKNIVPHIEQWTKELCIMKMGGKCIAS